MTFASISTTLVGISIESKNNMEMYVVFTHYNTCDLKSQTIKINVVAGGLKHLFDVLSENGVVVKYMFHVPNVRITILHGRF